MQNVFSYQTTREGKQVDLSIQTITATRNKKKVVPLWKHNLPPNPTEARRPKIKIL